MPLFSSTVLDHFRRPRNRGALDDADVSHEADNPVCGDRIRIALRVREGRVAEARFRGDACALGTAAASILTGMLSGRTLDEATAIGEAELTAALDAEVPAARRRCVTLPLEALRDGIAAYRAGGAAG